VRGTTQVTQVRAKWSELPAELTTWEDYKALKQTFPHALAWGQAGSQEPGNVSTGSDAGGMQQRGARPRKQSSKYSDPEWVQPSNM
jgi:hypothetical protein